MPKFFDIDLLGDWTPEYAILSGFKIGYELLNVGKTEEVPHYIFLLIKISCFVRVI